MKKLLKKEEGTFRSSVYDLDKFSFVNDTIYLWAKNRIGSFSKKEIRAIEKKFKL
jgi:acyl-ACP thioesterase